jgi:hypothetical protein
MPGLTRDKMLRFPLPIERAQKFVELPVNHHPVGKIPPDKKNALRPLFNLIRWVEKQLTTGNSSARASQDWGELPQKPPHAHPLGGWSNDRRHSVYPKKACAAHVTANSGREQISEAVR